MELSEALEMLIAAALQGDIIKTNQWAMHVRANYTLDAIAMCVSSTFGSHKNRVMAFLTGRSAVFVPTVPAPSFGRNS